MTWFSFVTIMQCCHLWFPGVHQIWSWGSSFRKSSSGKTTMVGTFGMKEWKAMQTLLMERHKAFSKVCNAERKSRQILHLFWMRWIIHEFAWGGKVMNGCMLPLVFSVYQQHVVQRMFVTVKHVLLDALLLRDHAYICERAGFDLWRLLAKLSIKEWIAFDFPMQTNKGKENSYKVRSLRNVKIYYVYIYVLIVSNLLVFFFLP